MAFLNRLFNRKSKTELSSPAPLRRSLTDPAPSARNASSSDKSDVDTFDIRPPSSRLGGPRRRAGCDIARSKTSVDIGASVRSSSVASSVQSTEPLSTSADGSKNQYRQVKALHRSRMHTIMAAQDRSTKRAVVMKTFQKLRLSSTLKARIDSEIQHLRALSGIPGVVKYVNHFEDEECIYLVLERSPGTTLIELIANCGGRMSEAALVLDVLTPLVLLLADLHRRGIVHRQIKPEHVLVAPEGGGITLVDWAEAVNKKQRCLNNRAGTLEYMAPEVLDKPTAEEVFHQVLYNGMSEEELPQYDEKADVWSLGALAFEALTGCQPFLADSAADMSQLQRESLTQVDPANGYLRAFSGRPLSPEARSFLQAALQLDPLNRPSAERLLQHALVQRYWPRFQAKRASQAVLSGEQSAVSMPAAAAAAITAAASLATTSTEVSPYSLTTAAAASSPQRRGMAAGNCTTPRGSAGGSGPPSATGSGSGSISGHKSAVLLGPQAVHFTVR